MICNSVLSDPPSAATTISDRPRCIPADIAERLSPAQTERLETMLASAGTARGSHGVDYQVSSSLLGRTFYISLFAGKEMRSPARLRDAGLSRRIAKVAVDVAAVCFAVSTLLCLLTGAAVITLYIVKSALGIDLMEGPSPLHQYFYWR